MGIDGGDDGGENGGGGGNDDGGPNDGATDADPRVASSFADQGLMRALGARLVSAGGGACVIEAPMAPHLTQQDGFFHAGVTASLADTAAGYAAFTLMGADERVLTIEFKVNLIRPAAGTLLRAEARVVRRGRRVTVVEATARVRRDGAWRDGAWRDCARFLGTMMAIPAE